MPSVELSESLTFRVAPALRERLREYRKRVNAGSPNPLNESDVLRLALGAGADKLEAGE